MKLYKNHTGRIGVVVSPSYGIGWYSQNGSEYPECATDPELVAMVLEYQNLYESDEYSYRERRGSGSERHMDFVNMESKIAKYASEKWPNGYWSSYNLYIEWVPAGSMVKFSVYDGAESMEWESIDRSYTLLIPLED